MAKAKSVIDVMLGEGGGKTAAERYADYLAIGSVIANRATQLGVTPEQVVQRQSEFNAYNKPLPGGVDKYRGIAEKALGEIARNGPIHKATFYATPKAVGNLPRGLTEEVRTGSHIYKSDPQNRAVYTSVGLKSPDTNVRYQPNVTLGSVLEGPVSNGNGDTLLGRVPGSKPIETAYRDPFVSAPNFRGNAPTVQLTTNQDQRMINAAGQVRVGQGGRAGGAAMFGGGITTPAQGFEAPRPSANSKVYSAPLNAPGVPYTPAQQATIRSASLNSLTDGLNAQRQSLAASRNPANYDGVPGLLLGVNLSGQQTYARPTVSPGSTLLGPVTNGNNDTLLGPVSPPVQNPMVTGWGSPVKAVAPVQSVIPAPGDQLLGPVDPRAKDYAKTQKRAAIPGLIGKVGGSMAGGALLGPVGGILGGMLGGYIAKNGNFKNEPLNINNIGAGSSNVYSVYGGAPRGTQAQANNGSLITSLGQGATAYTNRYGVSNIIGSDGTVSADWSGRSYKAKK